MTRLVKGGLVLSSEVYRRDVYVLIRCITVRLPYIHLKLYTMLENFFAQVAQFICETELLSILVE